MASFRLVVGAFSSLAIVMLWVGSTIAVFNQKRSQQVYEDVRRALNDVSMTLDGAFFSLPSFNFAFCNVVQSIGY